MTRRRVWVLAVCFMVAATLGWWLLKKEAETLHRNTRLIMGTVVEITLVGEPKKVRKVEDAVVAELNRVERLCSFHLADSGLSRLNDRAGQGWIPVEPELFALIEKSVQTAEKTGGAYDPSVGPVCRLWNFSGTGSARLPSAAEIAEALPKVGWRKIGLNPGKHSVSLELKGMALDLGGISKGYALDRAGHVIRAGGIRSGLVNAGGDVLAVGERAPGRKWRIGVRDPLRPNAIVAAVEISDEVILTSGDYERCFQQEGKNYHHILVPGTGYPAEGLSSVTLLGSEGAAVEPLGTGAFVLGPEKGMELLASFPGVEGLLITSEGAFLTTPGARKRFTLK
ncbi:MAG: FAD:protein FMN transferase [Thermodesulfobacteriota bacterium]